MKNYNINREAAKMPGVSSCKIDKYEYRTGEEVLPSNQTQSQSKYRTNQVYIPSSRKNIWKRKKKLKMLLKNKEERLKKQLRNKKSIYKL